MEVIQILRKLGYNTSITEEYQKLIQTWMLGFKGEIKGFHKYKEYNGEEEVNRERKTLGMFKQSAEDWADTIFNDSVDINIADEEEYQVVDTILKRNGFRSQYPEFIELSFALGTGANVEFKDSLGEAKVDFVSAEKVFPLEIDNKEIVGCAFVSMYSDTVVYLNIHERQRDNTYIIYNLFLEEEGTNLKEVYVEGVEEMVARPIKTFQIVKPAIVNNLSPSQAMGISIYANAYDEAKSVDTSFDSLDVEIDNGKKKMYVKTSAMNFNIDKDGEQVPIFDKNQSVYYVMPEEDNATGSNKLIEESNGELRVDPIVNALQTQLNLFSRKVGFGDGYYTFKDGTVYTNTTQVISSNSKMYKTLRKHEKKVESALIGMVKALYYLETGKELISDVTVDFDDSIIEDTAEIKRQALIEYNADLIDKIEYYMITRKLTEKQAIKLAKEMEKRTPTSDEDPPPED